MGGLSLFPVEASPIFMDEKVTMHFRLTSARESGERLILLVSLAGLLALLVLAAGLRPCFSLKSKQLYLLAFSGAELGPALLFGRADPGYTVLDHLLTQLRVILRLRLVFLASLIISRLQNRKAFTATAATKAERN